MTSKHLFLAALLAGTVALAACNRDAGMDTTADRAATGNDMLETPPGMTEAERNAATDLGADAANVTITDVHLGTEVDDNRAVLSPQTSFSANDETIHVAITTVSASNAPATATLGVRWTFQDGQLIDERSAALEFTGTDTTDFHVENTEGWPMGSYNVEITLNGQAVETRQFTIQ